MAKIPHNVIIRAYIDQSTDKARLMLRANFMFVCGNKTCSQCWSYVPTSATKSK